MIGALEFEFVAVATAQLPNSGCTTRFPVAGLEVDLFVDGGDRFCVIDHRSAHGDTDEPARVELWRCHTQGEGEAPDLLVAADRRTGHGESGAVRASSLRALSHLT